MKTKGYERSRPSSLPTRSSVCHDRATHLAVEFHRPEGGVLNNPSLHQRRNSTNPKEGCCKVVRRVGQRSGGTCSTALVLLFSLLGTTCSCELPARQSSSHVVESSPGNSKDIPGIGLGSSLNETLISKGSPMCIASPGLDAEGESRVTHEKPDNLEPCGRAIRCAPSGDLPRMCCRTAKRRLLGRDYTEERRPADDRARRRMCCETML